MSVDITVVLPTRNPDLTRLSRALAALGTQSLPRARWELLIVDNASDTPWKVPPTGRPDFHRLDEPALGLTSARIRGIEAAQGELIVFVDDDNVLDPGYLHAAVRLFSVHPRLGAAGGPVLPEWEAHPPPWTAEFQSLLALRDFGAQAQVQPGSAGAPWPSFAPVGAGLTVRRAAAHAYAEAVRADPLRRSLDRSGQSLGSGGDNDLVFSILHGGDDVGYFPELRLIHLIPSARLEANYLARLNSGIMRTWVVVLHLHGQCPWPPIRPCTVPLRSARAWLRTRPWRSPANKIRWRGRCGQFQGQAALWKLARE